MAGTILTIAFTFGFVVLAGINAGSLVERLARTDPQAAVQVLPFLLAGMAVLTLVTSLSSAFHHLYLAGDLELLLVTPVTPASVFGLKILEIWRDSLHVILFQAAALFGFGQSLHLPVQYYGVAFFIGLLLTIAAAAVGATLTLGLARVRFGESILGFSRILAVLLFLPIGVLGVPALGIGRNGSSFLLSPSNLNAVTTGLDNASAPPAWAPTTWAAHVLLADDDAWLSLGLLLATSIVLFAGMQLAYAGLFQGGWERVRFSVTARTDSRKRLRFRLPGTSRPRGPLADLLLKDWRTVIRDPRWRTGTLVSLIALGLPVMFVFVGDPLSRSPHLVRFWFGMIPVPYLAYLVGSQQGASPLAYEGRNLALLRAAPVGIGRILVAKVLGGLLLVLLVTWSATLALGLSHGGQPAEMTVAMFVATWLAIGGTVAAVAGAALTADFESDNPQRRIGCLGTIVTSALAIFFFVANTGTFGWWVARSLFSVPRAFSGVVPVADWGLPTLALLSVAAIVLAIRLGARRIENWDLS
jgi:hypothetical protein